MMVALFGCSNVLPGLNKCAKFFIREKLEAFLSTK